MNRHRSPTKTHPFRSPTEIPTHTHTLPGEPSPIPAVAPCPLPLVSLTLFSHRRFSLLVWHALHRVAARCWGGVLMGVFFQQSGWLCHEICHHQCFKNRIHGAMRRPTTFSRPWLDSGPSHVHERGFFVDFELVRTASGPSRRVRECGRVDGVFETAPPRRRRRDAIMAPSS